MSDYDALRRRTEAVEAAAARLREALEYVWDRCGPHTELSPCLDAAQAAQKALTDTEPFTVSCLVTPGSADRPMAALQRAASVNQDAHGAMPTTASSNADAILAARASLANGTPDNGLRRRKADFAALKRVAEGGQAEATEGERALALAERLERTVAAEKAVIAAAHDASALWVGFFGMSGEQRVDFCIAMSALRDSIAALDRAKEEK